MKRAAVAGGLFATAVVTAFLPAGREAAFTLRLHPVRAGGEVRAVEVLSSIAALPDSLRSSLVLRAPVVYPGVAGVADRITNLDVRDGAGPVPLQVEEDPPVPGGFPYYRHWHAERAVRPPVSISYTSLVQPSGGADGPPFGLRPTAGGVSGAGAAFLLLPDIDGPVDLRLSWDLSGLAPGSVGIATLGEGDVSAKHTLGEVGSSWFLAGPAGRYPDAGQATGFTAAWLGTPPFDARAEMAATAAMYRSLADVFGYLDPAPEYRVFMRILDEPPFGGGTALANSFMLSRGPATGPEEPPRDTFVHEMVHMWVGGIQAPNGVSSWFSEGLTTYYARVLPMRAGFDSVAAFGRTIDAAFVRYFTSPARNLSADSIARLGFTDPIARRVPYERGFLYFADLDARIRAHSDGRRTLDTLMAEIFVRRAAGMRFDHDAWRRAVTEELGPAEADRFDRIILQGETIVPASDAFGPCFARVPARIAVGDSAIDGFEWRRTGLPDTHCRTG